MAFVLKRVDQGGGYVAPPGSAKSYVRDAFEARRFPTRAAALAEACGNEVALDLNQGTNAAWS